MSAPTTSTIGTGGTYSTLSAWLADMPADITTGAGAGNYSALLKSQSWTNSTNFGSFLSLTGVTTDSTHKITIGCDTGASFRDHASKATNPLRPDATKGVCLIMTGGYGTGLSIGVPNVVIYGLQVSAAGSQTPAIDCTGQANTLIDSCILQAATGSSNHATLFRLYGSAAEARNTVAIAAGSGTVGPAIRAGLGAKVSDCTAVKTAESAASGTGIALDYSDNLVKGAAIFGFSTAIGGSGTPDSASDYNATDLSSLGTSIPGTHNLVSKSFSSQFQNTGSTLSSADFRLKSGADLIDAGTAISGITTDIIGTTRSSPDIGAWEFASAADTTAPTVSSANVNSAGTTLTIAFTEAGSPPVLPASSVTGFTLSASGGAVTLSSTAISGTTYTATTSRTINSGETLTLAYTPGNVTDSATSPNSLASFSGTSVTNNSTQTPSLSAGSVTSSTVKLDIAASAASGGTGSITYQWYGSTINGFTPGGGNLLSGQTGQNLSAYTAAPGSTYYFVRRATDSAGTPATADTSQYTVSAVAGGGGVNSYPRGRLVNA